VEKLHKKFGERIEIIGINLGIKKEIEGFLKKRHITFPIAYDKDNVVASAFDAKVDTHILIDRKGVIRFKERGFPEDMDKEIEKLIELRNPK
jgi:peroxiredoxin